MIEGQSPLISPDAGTTVSTLGRHTADMALGAP
jgi:hypothetical protein